MANFCKTCGRPKHKGLCDMAELSDGRVVHVTRIDKHDGDIRQEIERGLVKVRNRFIRKEPPKKKTARRS
jgi:hypothetical protein